MCVSHHRRVGPHELLRQLTTRTNTGTLAPRQQDIHTGQLHTTNCSDTVCLDWAEHALVPLNVTNVWARRLTDGGGGHAVVFTNVGLESADISCNTSCFEAMGYARGQKLLAHDVLAGRDLPPITDSTFLAEGVPGEGAAGCGCSGSNPAPERAAALISHSILRNIPARRPPTHAQTAENAYRPPPLITTATCISLPLRLFFSSAPVTPSTPATNFPPCQTGLSASTTCKHKQRLRDIHPLEIKSWWGRMVCTHGCGHTRNDHFTDNVEWQRDVQRHAARGMVVAPTDPDLPPHRLEDTTGVS